METLYLIVAEWRIYALPTLAIIDANNSLCVRHQAIIWTNAAIVLIGPFETNFSEFLFLKFIHFHSRKIHLKMVSEKCRPSCLDINVLTLLSETIMRSV